MADGAEPLVLAGRAARRLQLLLGHGARPGGSAAAAPGAPEAPRLLRLEAGVLHAPVQLAAGVAEGTGEAWQRDPLAEVAVHLDTLRALTVRARGVNCNLQAMDGGWCGMHFAVGQSGWWLGQQGIVHSLRLAPLGPRALCYLPK